MGHGGQVCAPKAGLNRHAGSTRRSSPSSQPSPRKSREKERTEYAVRSVIHYMSRGFHLSPLFAGRGRRLFRRRVRGGHKLGQCPLLPLIPTFSPQGRGEGAHRDRPAFIELQGGRRRTALTASSTSGTSPQAGPDTCRISTRRNRTSAIRGGSAPWFRD